MSRRLRSLMISIPVLLLLSFSTAVLADNDGFKSVQITSEKVGSGIHMLQGRGGNIGVSVGEDGVFLIDDQFAPLTKKIKKAIKAISKEPIRFVLNTHWHGDHTGGNENLGKSGTVIVAHENVRNRLSMEQFIEAFGRKVPAAPEEALPTITFKDEVTFHLNGETIEVRHVKNAHTDGDSIVFFTKANIVHTGDVFFNGSYPFIDVSSGGSLDGVIAAANMLLTVTNDGTKFIPGHGPSADRNDLTAYRDMLTDLKKNVAKLMRSGSPLREVIAAQPTALYDEKWGTGFLKPRMFTEILYASLKNRKTIKK